MHNKINKRIRNNQKRRLAEILARTNEALAQAIQTLVQSYRPNNSENLPALYLPLYQVVHVPGPSFQPSTTSNQAQSQALHDPGQFNQNRVTLNLPLNPVFYAPNYQVPKSVKQVSPSANKAKPFTLPHRLPNLQHLQIKFPAKR